MPLERVERAPRIHTLELTMGERTIIAGRHCGERNGVLAREPAGTLEILRAGIDRAHHVAQRSRALSVGFLVLLPDEPEAAATEAA